MRICSLAQSVQMNSNEINGHHPILPSMCPWSIITSVFSWWCLHPERLVMKEQVGDECLAQGRWQARVPHQKHDRIRSLFKGLQMFMISHRDWMSSFIIRSVLLRAASMAVPKQKANITNVLTALTCPGIQNSRRRLTSSITTFYDTDLNKE